MPHQRRAPGGSGCHALKVPFRAWAPSGLDISDVGLRWSGGFVGCPSGHGGLLACACFVSGWDGWLGAVCGGGCCSARGVITCGVCFNHWLWEVTGVAGTGGGLAAGRERDRLRVAGYLLHPCSWDWVYGSAARLDQHGLLSVRAVVACL